MTVQNANVRCRTSFNRNQAKLHYNALEVLEEILEQKANRLRDELKPRETRIYIKAETKLMEVRVQKQVLEIEGNAVWGRGWWESV